MRLPWLTMTPLGSPVEPEVYCRKARVLAVMWGGCQVGVPAGGSSVLSQCRAASSGVCSKRWVMFSRILPVVRAKRALESATMPWMRGSGRLRRGA